jgi:hypothetical protein
MTSSIKVLAGDFKGDRRTDVMKFDMGNPAGLWVGLSQSTYFATSKWADWYMTPGIPVLAGDFDGDGATDVAKLDAGIPGGVWVGLSQDGTFATTQWDREWVSPRTRALVGDFDGDGRDDLVKVDEGSSGVVWVARSTGTTFEPQHVSDWWNLGTEQFLIGKFDYLAGDDLMKFDIGAPAGVWVGLSRTAGDEPKEFPVVISQSLTRYARKSAAAEFELQLTSGGGGYEQAFDQDDEPEDNYCGPTAGKNLLHWYGKARSYETLASAMSTNDWANGLDVLAACSAACSFEPLCAGSCYTVVNGALEVGTLPDDMAHALDLYKPSGYRVYRYESASESIHRMLSQVAEGNPVVALQSTGKRNLHWVVVTGTYFDANSNLVLRIANSENRTVNDFLSDWSLSKVGNSAVRKVLKELGLVPYIMIHYDR